MAMTQALQEETGCLHLVCAGNQVRLLWFCEEKVNGWEEPSEMEHSQCRGPLTRRPPITWRPHSSMLSALRILLFFRALLSDPVSDSPDTMEAFSLFEGFSHIRFSSRMEGVTLLSSCAFSIPGAYPAVTG